MKIFIGNTTSVIPSTTSNSIPISTTLNPTNTPPSYTGRVSLARPSEGPADIWADRYDVYLNVLTVKMGTTVTWTDFDTVAFMVVSDEGLFVGHIAPNRRKWSYLFKDPGTFDCAFNPYEGELNGVVIVLE